MRLPAIKIIVTGNGRVSQGAQYLLDEIGARRLDNEAFLTLSTVDKLAYSVVDVDKLVRRKDGNLFSIDDFFTSPREYESDFMRWGQCADLLISAHFWSPDAPVYLSEEDLRSVSLKIKMIGDITCDIMGSIKSTLRSSTHADPYYDYNPVTCKEENAFSSNDNITVMAVDTCPNALAMDTSDYFGEMLVRHVFEPLLKGEKSEVIERATILKNGQLTTRFSYLENFAKE